MHDTLLATKGDHKKLLKGDYIHVMIDKNKKIYPYEEDYKKLNKELETWNKNLKNKNSSFEIDLEDLR